jgi:hypothetical protein
MSLLVLAFAAIQMSTFAFAIPTDALKGKELRILQGKWEGELEYLDFSDGKSKVRLSSTFDCKYSETERKVSISIQFREPNGKIINGTSSITLLENGDQVLIDGEQWKVATAKVSATPDSLVIVLERKGADNNKPADLKKIIRVEKGSTFTYTKQVRYQDGEAFFTRNEYRLRWVIPQ